MYGKIENGALIEAPLTLELENGKVIENFNKSIKLMTEHGFKPVVDTKPGYDVDTQYCNFVRYNDTGRYIRFEWEVVDIEPSEAEIQNAEAQKAMEMLNMDFQAQVQTLPDEQALMVPSVFPVFQVGVEYKVGFKLRFNDVLYKVLQDHTSQEGWEPDKAPSLFAKVLVGEVDPDTGEPEILDWVQPDSTNAYMMGDKVRFEGEVYESVIDNNTWSPKEYPQGWMQLTGEVVIDNGEALENPEE